LVVIAGKEVDGCVVEMILNLFLSLRLFGLRFLGELMLVKFVLNIMVYNFMGC